MSRINPSSYSLNRHWPGLFTFAATVIFLSACDVDEFESSFFDREPPCAEEVLVWENGGTSCSVQVDARADDRDWGESIDLVDDSAPGNGLATFQCVGGTSAEGTPIGVWTLQPGSSCVPADCEADSVAWNDGGSHNCTASTTATTHGGSITIGDLFSPDVGNATFSCNDGGWELQAGSSCGPGPCDAQLLRWDDGGSNACSANTSQSNDGDTVALTDAILPTKGSADFSCSNGTWALQPGSSCTTVICPAQTLNWDDGGSNACSANAAVTVEGNTVGLVDTDSTGNPAGVGYASFTCDNNADFVAIGTPVCASSLVNPPCPAQTLQWDDGNGNQCSTFAAQRDDGQTIDLTDASDPLIGEATFSCNNTVWSVQPGASCSIAPCAAITLNWNDGGSNACSADAVETADGGVANFADLNLPVVGTASYSCVETAWVLQAGSSCNPAPTGPRDLAVSMNAAPGSRLYEYSSDAYAELGTVWGGNPLKNAFFDIDTGDDVGNGITFFSNNGFWQEVMTLTYNMDGLTGIGNEQAPITAAVGDFNEYMDGFHFNIITPYTTDITLNSGTNNNVVALQNGVPINIVLDATVNFRLEKSGLVLDFYGPFTINNDHTFSLDAGPPHGPSHQPVIGNPDWVWDITGTVNPVTFQ